jgi:hypothetical protein
LPDIHGGAEVHALTLGRVRAIIVGIWGQIPPEVRTGASSGADPIYETAAKRPGLFYDLASPRRARGSDPSRSPDKSGLLLSV